MLALLLFATPAPAGPTIAVTGVERVLGTSAASMQTQETGVDGALLVQVDFSSRRPFRGFRRAFIAWLDRDVDPPGTTFPLALTYGTARVPEYELYPLVPVVERTMGGVSQHPGYPADGKVTWPDSLRTASVVRRGPGVPSGFARLEILIQRAHPRVNPAPLCLLTDAFLVSG